MKALLNGGLILIVALSLGINAFAAERLAAVVQKSSGPPANEASSGSTLRTWHYSGIVVDADGRPVANAKVECFPYNQGRFFGVSDAKEDRQAVTTGTNGLFEFDAPRAATVLFARKPGLAPAWNQYWNPVKNMTDQRLVLAAPTTLAGTVVDDAGKPVADAEVWVSTASSERQMENGGRSYAYLNGKPAREGFSARTSAEGRFRIEDFPTNAAADLAVFKPGKVLRELQRDNIGPETMRCQAGQQDIKLVLEPAGGIEGKVVAKETGQPVAGARLRLQSLRPGPGTDLGRDPAQSEADGSFRLTELAAGDYRLHPTFGSNQTGEWVADSVLVSVESGQTTRDVRVTAVRGGFLEVSVVGKEDRKPLVDAGVSAYKEAVQASGGSDSNGMARLHLPPGEYQVSAYWQASRSEPAKVNVETGMTNRLEIELNPPPRITGLVRDPAGLSVAGLKVALYGGYSSPNAGETQTDASGRFELNWNPNTGGSDRAFCLIARDVTRNLAVAQDVDENNTAFDLRLEPGLSVAGRVQDSAGNPLANSTVQIHHWIGNMGNEFDVEPIKVDSQGRFEIGALPPTRRFTLWLNAKGYGSANVELEPNPETNRIDLAPVVLKIADQKVAGQIVDADDKPVARAWVNLYGQGQPNDSVRADDQGRFIFKQVCEGTVQIYANAQRAYGNARAESGDTNVVVKLGVQSSSPSVNRPPKRPSLKGKPLPDLSSLGLAANLLPAGKPVLLCLFDLEQRPSRRVIRLLAEQNESLRQKGLTVLGAQATVISPDTLKDWKNTNPAPFPIGCLPEKKDQTQWASVESLPWLVLTDPAHKVIAEGFALDELETKLAELTK